MKRFVFTPILIAMILFMGCDEYDLGSNDPTGSDFSSNGYIQKGPFITGTSVDVKELDSSLNSTGRTFSTQITNDFGSFKVQGTSDETFAEFVADGYYFDEVEGELSESKLTLRAISKINQSTNINVLTTLQTDRIKYLIQNGEDYDDALVQSQDEVLKLFNINQNEVANFSSMNISEQGISNSILLAISSILQSERSVAEMSELISKLSLDIADNGVVDNTVLTDKITESSMQINVAEIIRNLEQRYSSLGESVTIDNFYDFIDSDGDGVLNGSVPYLFVDDNDYTFDYTASQQVIYFSSNYTPSVEIVSDDNFISVVSIEGSKVTLELSENKGKKSLSAELQFKSPEGNVVETVVVEQASSYSELSFNLSFGAISRSTLPNSDVELGSITMIAFDSNGDLLFNNTDNLPELNGSEYKLYIKLEDNYYPDCTLYTIVNGTDDYSTVTDMSYIDQLKSDVSSSILLTAKNEGVEFSSGRPNDDGSLTICSVILISLEYAGVANVVFEINYDQSVPESDREITELKLIGQIFTNTYLFKDATDNLDGVSSTYADTESLSCLVGGGSVFSSLSITLKGGVQYATSLPNEITLQSGYQYSFNLTINPSSATSSSTNVDSWNEADSDGTIGFSTTTTGSK